ncbi:MAG: hypothetical protein IKM90_00555 [Bacteroidaceae bacterium]|nr:hypothetical protein [Bacteroidaceae bacterium]
MAYRKFRIVLSKGWTYMICSLSVAVLALVGCRSKKVAQQQQEPELPQDAADASDEYQTRANSLAQTVILPSDSKEVQAMIKQVNSLKKDLSDRMNSVIYGTPEVMQRRAQENRALRARIDSLDNVISKARLK